MNDLSNLSHPAWDCKYHVISGFRNTAVSKQLWGWEFWS